ncbi:hypothetical protein D3C87_1805300 [compost metagenome]
MATMRSKSSSRTSSILPRCRMPALTTRMSSRPKRARVWSTAASIWAASALSALMATAWPPLASIAARSVSALSGELA